MTEFDFHFLSQFHLANIAPRSECWFGSPVPEMEVMWTETNSSRGSGCARTKAAVVRVEQGGKSRSRPENADGNDESFSNAGFD